MSARKDLRLYRKWRSRRYKTISWRVRDPARHPENAPYVAIKEFLRDPCFQCVAIKIILGKMDVRPILI